MSIRLVDNKKLDMTEDEWDMYTRIVKSYTIPPTSRGEDLFIGLFESDDNGNICFLRPPSKRQTSFEVFLFLMSLMQHQHLRALHRQVDDLCAQVKEKLK